MTDIKSDIKAAILELLAEMTTGPKTSATTGFGSMDLLSSSRRIHVQATGGVEHNPWYTYKEGEGDEGRTYIEEAQYTGRVTQVCWVDQESDFGPSKKLEVTMADEAGTATTFVFGLRSMTQNGWAWVTAGKSILASLEVVSPTDLFSFAPRHADQKVARGKVVLISCFRNGVELNEPQKDREDWEEVFVAVMERFGGSRRAGGNQVEESEGFTNTPAQPVKSAAKPAPSAKTPPAAAEGVGQYKDRWLKLYTYGGTTPEHKKYNTEAITAWVWANYTVKKPSLIPLGDQALALDACEVHLHSLYHPEEQEPEVVAAPVATEPDFDDIPF